MIDLSHIDRTFRVGDQEVHALRDVSLSIARGEYVSIMGPSGSGKSTLLHIVGLLDRPNGGRYRLNGDDVTALSEEEQARTRREQIGFVFQFFHLVPRLTAAENVELPLILAGVDPEQRKPRVTRALQAMGIADRAHHRPDQLSGGQRQRAAIARATIMEPAVLLADEPTGNLDRASGLDVIDVLEALVNKGIAVVVVTHDPLIGERAHRRIRMEDGRVITDERRPKSEGRIDARG
jgi:putative ABC transport system ATP-binding protein